MTVYLSVPLPIYLWLICIKHRLSESAFPPSLSLKTNHLTLIKVGSYFRGNVWQPVSSAAECSSVGSVQAMTGYFYPHT